MNRPSETPHGRGRYSNHGCRCDTCRTENTAEQREYRTRVSAAKLADPTTPHGVPSTYRNWGCRCDECRAAEAAARRQSRANGTARLQAEVS